MKRNLRKLAHLAVTAYERRRLRGANFALVSNNCWGFELYQALSRPYNTPFVGLFLFPDCYLRLLEDYPALDLSSLSFIHSSRHIAEKPAYPVGVLDNGAEIHFMHYESESDAAQKWTRRTERFNDAIEKGATLFFKFCDREGATQEHLRRFHSLPLESKVSMGITPFSDEHHLHTPALKDPKGDCVIDGLRLYHKRYVCFDVTEWILTGELRQTKIGDIIGRFSA